VDPVGAILAVVVLDIILNGEADPLPIIGGLLIRLGIGAVIGVLGGTLLGLILKRATFLSEELKNLVVLAGLWGLFGLAQAVRSEAGLMTTVMAGIVVRAFSVPEERMLRRFKGQLTILAVSVLFILLAADLSVDSIFALGQGAVFTVLVLMFVVRPINIWCCTWNSDLNWRQKFFLSWVAPRGIVSASVASLFAILLTDRGINGGDSIKALVFLTIILTVLLQGLTAGWIAKFLKISSEEATGAVIIGCNPVSVLVARLFKDRGESVVMIDTDQAACQLAEQEHLTCFVSSALDTEVLEEAGLASAGTFLAMTKNGEVNAVLAQRAVEEFQPPRVLALFPSDKQNTSEPGANPDKPSENQPAKAKPQSASPKIQPAFIPQLPLKTWNTYLADGAVKLGETLLRKPAFSFQQAHLRALMRSGELVPLLVEREGQLQVVVAEDAWQVGDRIIYLLHAPKPKLLQRLSGGTTQPRLEIEKLPAVEEVPMPASVAIEDLIQSNSTPETAPEAAPETNIETTTDTKPEPPIKAIESPTSG
ncbi:MAG: sodium:proton antiporter, partial [Cyanothece sp. SIO1E1]|nr:sodium:proton antiporter [Cyanothece sp. SIO1E1]